ncbi:MAG: prepilin peptidase [Bifidobacteriaceae bacterium]|jgi:leader peptidase (prepilin peptidase)/N-methyltransferase|nr:prepilin peptidase [Bifidobacteriaceae bacterium]
MTGPLADAIARGVAAGLLGLVIGSFLTVVITRAPERSSLWPRSACPKCGQPVKAKDNVPIVSWLILRGRCRSCGEPISGLYPIVEAVTAVLFAAVAVFIQPLAAVPAYLYAAAAAVALTAIDARTGRLPDAIVLPSYPVMAALLALASWLTGDWGALARAGIGGLGLLVGYGLVHLVRPRGMGRGDVKLAGLIGLALAYQGWGPFAVGALGAFLLGALWGIGVMIKTRGGRKTAIPFGPWMCAGAVLGCALGAPLWDLYRQLMQV